MIHWMIGNRDKKQLQLNVHFGIQNPMKEVLEMATIKEEAKNYVAPETKNIAELEKVSVDLELKTKVVHEGEADSFSYRYTEINDEEYRVPVVVIKQLKAQIEANKDLKFFRVAKTGAGLKTEYTVIPVK